MGGIGGAVWHGVKGFRNSPYGERRIGAITAIKSRAPVLGGNFGVWGGLFSTFDCAVKGIRKKEDPYNASMSLARQGSIFLCEAKHQRKANPCFSRRIAVIAGFFTGGALAVRGGAKAARNSAIGCAILLAVIEGVGIGIQRMMAENTRLDVSAPWNVVLAIKADIDFATASTTSSARATTRKLSADACIIFPSIFDPMIAGRYLFLKRCFTPSCLKKRYHKTNLYSHQSMRPGAMRETMFHHLSDQLDVLRP